MKVHAKKKAYRTMIHSLAKAGKMNDADGKMVDRSQIKDSSMKWDYYPQPGHRKPKSE